MYFKRKYAYVDLTRDVFALEQTHKVSLFFETSSLK